MEINFAQFEEALKRDKKDLYSRPYTALFNGHFRTRTADDLTNSSFLTKK